jgi:multisubunit Na+/H+ antiporter MnhF subunit
MNAWLACATVLLFCLVPCGIVVFRGPAIDRLVGLEMAGLVDTLLLVMLAQGFHRIPFYDLALALALLAFGGGLVFARFFERWL